MKSANLKCPNCGMPMELKRTTKYTTRDGKPRLFYGCIGYPSCKSTIGAHPDGTPLGTPADDETKQWRRKAHAIFDRFWKYYGMQRNEAYFMLQSIMKMGGKDAHIGNFNKEQCQYLISYLEKQHNDQSNA